MAILRSKAIALEIVFPYSRSDAIIYDFRITWHGHDFISRAARFRDDDSPELTEATPFYAWDHRTDRLCDTFDRALSANRPQYWEPIDPFISIGVMRGTGTLWRFYDWATAKGQAELLDELAQFDAATSDEDEFTVHLQIDPAHNLRYEESGVGSGDFGFTIYTERAPLSQFARELRSDFLDCQANRKMKPSPEDTLWRLTH
jgi:hypothetical protein